MSANDPNRMPTFNLKAVVQDTGLAPDTLRAWERRYGLPQPQRSSGGHRLYSQHDINVIKWLIARQEEGVSISNAVDLWNRLQAAGQDPLHPSATAPATSEAVQGESVADLRDAWISACLDFDEARAEQLLSQAFALYPLETTCFEVLFAGLSAIGEGWYQGEVTIQQEHFASALARRRLDTLITATASPTRPDSILAANPPLEEHDLGLLMLTLLLRRQGWDVVYLGANVPIEHLEATLTAIQPRLMVSSAQQLHTAATLLEMARFVQERGVPLAYSGRIFNLQPSLRSRIPGYFLGDHLQEAPRIVQQIIATTPSFAPVEPISPAYQEAAAHFQEQLLAIESTVQQSLEPLAYPSAYLAQANTRLRAGIQAALTLGDLDAVSEETIWVEGLLANYQLPLELLDQYLAVYYQAAAAHLDERGQPVLDCLSGLMEHGA